MAHSSANAFTFANTSACEVGTAELTESAAEERLVDIAMVDAIKAAVLVPVAVLLVCTERFVAFVWLAEEMVMLPDDDIVESAELLAVVTSVAMVTAFPTNVADSDAKDVLPVSDDTAELAVAVVCQLCHQPLLEVEEGDSDEAGRELVGDAEREEEEYSDEEADEEVDEYAEKEVEDEVASASDELVAEEEVLDEETTTG